MNGRAGVRVSAGVRVYARVHDRGEGDSAFARARARIDPDTGCHLHTWESER
jgi:hypothetical protein